MRSVLPPSAPTTMEMMMSDELLPCAHCGGKADPTGWMRSDGAQGPECESCGATAASAEAWNRRTPASDAVRHNPETPRADGGLRERVGALAGQLRDLVSNKTYLPHERGKNEGLSLAAGKLDEILRTALAAPDAGDGWRPIDTLVMDVRAIWLVCSGKVYEGWAHPPDARLRIATHYHERQERPAPPTVMGGVS